MKYTPLFLSLLSWCVLVSANIFFIENRSGYNIAVEFWKKNGEKKSYFLELQKDYVVDISWINESVQAPHDYKLRFVYLADNKIVHTDPDFFLINYLARKKLAILGPYKGITITEATKNMLDAANRNLNFKALQVAPFLLYSAVWPREGSTCGSSVAAA